MATVNSVLGPLDTSDLGFTLSHEHILETSAGIQQVYPEFVDREGAIAEANCEREHDGKCNNETRVHGC